jgi:hypothetical protein
VDQVKWNYFQYRQQFGYSIYLRIKSEELHSKYSHLFNEVGFTLLSEAEVKKIQLNKMHVKILTIQEASSRLQMQINGSDLLDQFGLESLSLVMGSPTYTFRKVGLMIMPFGKTLWDLGLSSDISHTDQLVGLRVILVRYLAHALADQGIISFWGTIKDDTVILMKQTQSFGEAVIIDVNKKMIFSNGGEMKLTTNLKIIRKDKEIRYSQLMTREDLIGFLSVSTCLLSFSGITPSMKKAIYDLSAISTASYAATETTANL